MVILHYRPIEHYPPIINLLRFFSNEGKSLKCISTNGKYQKLTFGDTIQVIRFGSQRNNKIPLWFGYVFYNLGALLYLLFRRPKNVLYYETMSSFPVVFYKLLVNKKVNVYIHYHEYTSPKEYKQSSKIEQFFHHLETKLYRKACWISHTNKIRLNKFLEDEKLFYNEKIHFTLPNYPSKNWSIKNKKWDGNENIKLVYFGYSLTKDGSYLQELIDWLSQTQIEVELNLYCLKKIEWIDSARYSNSKLCINIHSAIPYEEIPRILSDHHVGLILYKAVTPNYIYNAPNKLFEYLNCGLDVWFPKEMLGIKEYKSKETPKVLELDFSKKFVPSNFVSNQMAKISEEKIRYYAEDVYQQFLRIYNLK